MLMVILGAGASYDSYGSWPGGARAGGGRSGPIDPDDYRPPLTRDLFAEGPAVNATTLAIPECAHWVGYMRRLLQERGERQVESVEEILANLAGSPDPNLSKRATLAISLFMQRMLTECQNAWTSTVTANVTNYGTLLADIAVAGVAEACFVSFNYDTLFEQALPTIGVTIDSLESYVTHPAYKVVNPHGSLNWAHELSPQGITEFFGPPADAARWLIAHAPEVNPPPDFKYFPTPRFAVSPSPAAGLWPAIALPVARKADFECPKPHLDALDACVPKVSKLLTIGWRDAEQHFLTRLAGKLPRTVSALVVGRDRKDAGEIAVTLNGAGLAGRFQSANGGFTESLRKEIPTFLAEQLPTRVGR